MPALLSWVLLLGGIATVIAAAALATETEFEVAIALGGLLATLGGAVGLILGRVAGDAPADLRPPGASARVNLPSGPMPSSSGRRRSRLGRGPRTTSSGAATPGMAAIPTGPTRSGTMRMPVLLAAFFVGAAWQVTSAPPATGPLDYVAALLAVATPIALVLAVLSRLMMGHAWAPAVTVVLAGISLFIGTVVVSFYEAMVG